MPDLKSFQRWFVASFAPGLPSSKFAHAYRVGRSIKTNASLHVGKPCVIRLDIVDFFGNINTNRIYSLFETSGYTKKVSGLLASLCCLRGRLPQGAPSSPLISNAVMQYADNQIGDWALKNGWHFTRYADDMTFSGAEDPGALIAKVSDVLRAEGFKINADKTRVMRRGSRQITCGVVLNDMIGPPRSAWRSFFQEMYYIRKFGLQDHIAQCNIERREYVEVILGRAEHLRWLSEHRPDRRARVEEQIEFLKTLRVSA